MFPAMEKVYKGEMKAQNIRFCFHAVVLRITLSIVTSKHGIIQRL